ISFRPGRGREGGHQRYADLFVAALPLFDGFEGLGDRHDHVGAGLDVGLGAADRVVAAGVGAGDEQDIVGNGIADRADLAGGLGDGDQVDGVAHADGAGLGGDLVFHEHAPDACVHEFGGGTGGVDRVAIAGV